MDTLTKIKQRLNIDQRNLVSARVVSTSNATAKVRLSDGSERTAYLGSNTFHSGDLVQVAISDNTASIHGSATLQQTAAIKTIILS